MPVTRDVFAQENSRGYLRDIFPLRSTSIHTRPSFNPAFIEAKTFNVPQPLFYGVDFAKKKILSEPRNSPRKEQRKIHMTPHGPLIVPAPPVLAALSQRRDGATCPVGIGPPASRQPVVVRIRYLPYVDPKVQRGVEIGPLARRIAGADLGSGLLIFCSQNHTLAYHSPSSTPYHAQCFRQLGFGGRY